ncbi:MAG TPA: glycoside hydrolase family 2 TIM barrel-domain containing protein [bacterium]|nr:glycoside hydrolase family 2 TIM barrel-domain containing protein [bacterium]
MRQKISLSASWDLYFGPQEDVKSIDEAKEKFQRITATVPGDVYLDLLNAGLIEDPFYGRNYFDLRKFEFYQWWYEKEFDLPEEFLDKRFKLIFHGIDTIATIWLNGNLLGKTQDMFVEHEFDVTGLLKGKNTLIVKIDSPLLWAKEKNYDAVNVSWEGRDEALWLRKAQHSFGWDIAPRVVSSGIWKDVELREFKDDEIEELYYATSKIEENSADLDIFFKFRTGLKYFEEFLLRFTFIDKYNYKQVFEFPVEFITGHLTVKLDNPYLWYPKGYGEPDLYRVKCELLYNGEVLDERVDAIGIRTVHLERTETAEDGIFRFIINGIPVRARGSNWVPLDALHSRDKERTIPVLELFDDLGCNIIRCWGGGVYESEEFFNFCDSHGIMVWQDFALACARYPQREEFQKVLEEETRKVIRRLRNHPSLILWAGDNECDYAYNLENLLPSDNILTRKVLPSVCKQLDPYRPYLPSSPYLSDMVVRSKGKLSPPEQHLWGPRDYYKSRFYTENNAEFISEIGYHGCPNLESLKRFIPEEYLWTWDNDYWRAHSVEHWRTRRRSYNRNELMANQIKELFGFIPEKIEDFILASQISQAEAKKFFIERARFSDNIWGIIWWNVMDCWPQISDAIVDYYFSKKLAYSYIKRVQEPFFIMISEPEGWYVKVVGINDTLSRKEGTFIISDADGGEKVIDGNFSIEPLSKKVLGMIRVSRGEQKLFIINWQLDGKSYKNHYLLGNPPFSLERYTDWMGKIL